MVEIELPSELETVENILQKVGLESLTEKGIRALNKTAEEAVKETTPLFIAAIKDLTFEESKAILLGSPSAATDYLKSKTENGLYLKFQPMAEANFKKVGADQMWKTTIRLYTQIPLTKEVNPNLTDYVTSQALKEVYKMIEMEEIEIRNTINERSSLLLKKSIRPPRLNQFQRRVWVFEVFYKVDHLSIEYFRLFNIDYMSTVLQYK